MKFPYSVFKNGRNSTTFMVSIYSGKRDEYDGIFSENSWEGGQEQLRLQSISLRIQIQDGGSGTNISDMVCIIRLVISIHMVHVSL